MNTARRRSTDSALEHVLVIGGDRFGLAVAQYLTECSQTVTFVSADRPSGIADGVEALHRELSDASDVRALGSELTDVDLVVTLGSDAEALLTGYLARLELDPDAVVAGTVDPGVDPAFEGTGVARIDVPQLLAERIDDCAE